MRRTVIHKLEDMGEMCKPDTIFDISNDTRSLIAKTEYVYRLQYHTKSIMEPLSITSRSKRLSKLWRNIAQYR